MTRRDTHTNLEQVWKRARWACLAAWLGCVLALGGVGIGRAISLTRQRLDIPDFATYYLAARMLEISPTAIYDSAALETLRASSDVPSWAIPYGYPPFFAGLMRPLGRWPYQQAAAVWLALDVLCLIGGLAELLILTRWPAGFAGAIFALAALLLFTPAQEAILLGQLSPILLLLIVLALLLLDRPVHSILRTKPINELVAGILLGVATSTKVFPAILLVYLLLRRRWIAVLGGALGGVICLLAGLWCGGGWANTQTFFAKMLFSLYSARLAFVHLGNQSLTALFVRPLGDAPLLRALGLGAMLIVLVVTGLAVFARHPQRLTREYALVSMLPLLILPGVYTHMYVLILLPMALLARSWYNGTRWLAAPLLLSFLLLIVNSYSEWMGLRVAIWVPFGLIGTLIVWGILVHQVMQRSDECDPERK